jgi:hypothetical protein
MNEGKVRVYALSLEVAEGRLKQALLTRGAWMGVLSLCISVGVWTAKAPPGPFWETHSLGALGFMLALVLGICAATLWRIHSRERAVLGTYRLSLVDDRLRRVVAGMQDAELRSAEVTEIVEHGSGLVVVGNGRVVFIPSSLEGYAEVRNELTGWRQPALPDKQKVRSGRLAGIAATALLIAAWVAASWLEAPAPRGLATAVLYAVLIAWNLLLLRSPDVPRRMKVSVLLVSMFFGMAPLARLYLDSFARR